VEAGRLNDVVLIVDDSPSIVETVSFLLEAQGFPTVTAADGQAGLDLALLHRPRVVIVDANMPVLDGYGLCRALRATDVLAGCYVVFITGDPEATIRRRAVEAGADLYMGKPIDADKLESVVAEVFAGTRVPGGSNDEVRVVVRRSGRPGS
jgi:CheY-like chemotaxis protein